jgi:predicted NAD/FAD-binding protein
LLNIFQDGLPWSMVKGSSSAYVDAVIRRYPPHSLQTETAIHSVGNDKGGLWLKTAAGKVYFDNIILATSAVQALQILGDGATENEKDILGCFETTSNVVVLHTDTSVRHLAPLLHRGSLIMLF